MLVKHNLVSPKFMSNDKVKLHLADGSFVFAPRAMIKLDCANCLPNLPCDVLIGNIDGASCACTNLNTKFISYDDDHDSSISCLVTTRAQHASEGKP